MTNEQWKIFSNFKADFKNQIQEWSIFNDELKILQKNILENEKTPPYPLENPIVYNSALDEIESEDEIKIIVLGDNPGKNEQLSKNQKYLVGQAGKLAESFFKNHTELKIDFRKNAIILNKTPVHSAKTNELKTIFKNASKPLQKMILDSQIFMAEKTALLSNELNAKIFLVGYSELKPNGFFEPFKTTLKNCVNDINQILVFQHFSMNRFSIDLKSFMQKNPNLSLSDSILRLGLLHQKEFF